MLSSLESSLSFMAPVAFSTRPSVSRSATIDGIEAQGPLKPTNDFILVKKADAVEKTEGGILLTAKSKIVKTEGTVVAVGPGKVNRLTGAVVSVPVSPGEHVVFGKYDGTEVDIDGVKHMLIRSDDVLVKFSGEKLTMDVVDVVRDCVLVHVDAKETKTKGGLYLAKSKNDAKPSTGKVVKVGPGAIAADGTTISMEVAPNDQVKYRAYAGSEVEIGGEEYAVVRMDNILAKF